MKKQMIIMIVGAILCCLTPAFAMNREDHKDDAHKASSHQTPLEPLLPYDWSTHFRITIGPLGEPGNQILHTKSTNKPYIRSRGAMRSCSTNNGLFP